KGLRDVVAAQVRTGVDTCRGDREVIIGSPGSGSFLEHVEGLAAFGELSHRPAPCIGRSAASAICSRARLARVTYWAYRRQPAMSCGNFSCCSPQAGQIRSEALNASTASAYKRTLGSSR